MSSSSLWHPTVAVPWDGWAMLGCGVLSNSRPCPALPVLVGSHLEQSVPVLLGEVLHPWQRGVQQLENSLSCLIFVLEGSLQIFPFLSAYGALPRGCQELCQGWAGQCLWDVPMHTTLVEAPTGCGPGSSLLPLCSLSSYPGFLQRIECGAFKSIFVAEYILHSL